MRVNDPFVRLLTYLDARGRPFAACLDVVGLWGPPWQAVARGPLCGARLWPEGWHPLVPTVALGGLAAWLRRLWCRKPEADVLLPVLEECHGWLASRIIQWLIPFFQPFSSEVPVELTRISPQGIAWTLFTRVAETRGPAALLNHLPVIESQRLGPVSAPGDLIGLHVAIERLVSSWASAVDQELRPTSLPGGLRTSVFLAAYPEISGKQRRALDLLIRHSPLTRLVYADLVSLLPPASPARALEPLLTAGRGAWMEIWVAQLARSFLAALLTPPPELKTLDVVESRIRRLNDEEPGWGFFERSWKMAERNALERRRETLRQSIASGVAGCFRVARFIEPTQDGCCLQRHLLRLRVLDMLTRHLVTVWLPRLVHEWARHATDEVMRADPVLLGSTGLSCEAFEAALCKLRASEIGAILGQERGAELRSDIFAFLNPPILNEAELIALAHKSGLPETVVRRLVVRFGNDDGGVRLPFRYPNESGAPPATLLARWVPGLRAALPEPNPDRLPAASRLV